MIFLGLNITVSERTDEGDDQMTPKNDKGWKSALLGGVPEWVFEAIDGENCAFVGFARKCPHRVVDSNNEAVCNYHESSPGTCGPAFCLFSHRRQKAKEDEKVESEWRTGEEAVTAPPEVAVVADRGV